MSDTQQMTRSNPENLHQLTAEQLVSSIVQRQARIEQLKQEIEQLNLQEKSNSQTSSKLPSTNLIQKSEKVKHKSEADSEEKGWRDSLLMPFISVEKHLVKPLNNQLENWNIFRIAEKLGFIIVLISTLIGVVFYVIEAPERRANSISQKENSIYEAWQVVNRGQGEQSGVVVLALQRLKREEFSLEGIKLPNTNLNEANLQGANLKYADLLNCYLNRVKLSAANLTRSNLSGTDLRSADLSRADLKAANLINSDLTESDVRGTNFSNANLVGAHLRNVKWDKDTKFNKAIYNNRSILPSNLEPDKEKMHEVGPGLDLAGVDLSDTNMNGINLSNTDLSKAKLNGSRLNDVTLVKAKLESAELRNASLRRANLKGANLTNADLSNSNLFDANLTDANLKGVDLRTVDLCRTTMPNKDISYLDCPWELVDFPSPLSTSNLKSKRNGRR